MKKIYLQANPKELHYIELYRATQYSTRRYKIYKMFGNVMSELKALGTENYMNQM